MKGAFTGIAEGIAFVVKGFANFIRLIKSITDVAKRLPDSLKPKWLDNFSEGLGSAETKVRRLAEKIRKWGEQAGENWGKSMWAERAGQLAMAGLGIAHAQAPTLKGPAEAVPVKLDTPGEVKLAGAFEKGSKEAYQIIARYNSGQMFDSKDVAQKQLGVLNKIDDKLGKIEGHQKDLLDAALAEGEF
jgi:hypothetical protein